jgi:hypothetical protein
MNSGEDLEKWAGSRTLPAGDVFRARLILALADANVQPDHGVVANHRSDDFTMEAEV